MILPTLSGNLIAYDPIVAAGIFPRRLQDQAFGLSRGGWDPSERHDSSGK
jgi:hypothetical protein